jgi:hypothetical protein
VPDIPFRSSLFARTAGAVAAFDRSSTVFVDVAESSTRAEVSRGGFALGEIAVNPERLGSFLDQLPVVQTKVVTQAIAPGTAVARGTTIDIVLANTGDLPVNVIPGIHQAFADLTMSQLHAQFADNAAVRDIVRLRTSADELTAADQEALSTALQTANVPIDTTNTVGSAFTAIQAAFTFQG